MDAKPDVKGLYKLIVEQRKKNSDPTKTVSERVLKSRLKSQGAITKSVSPSPSRLNVSQIFDDESKSARSHQSSATDPLPVMVMASIQTQSPSQRDKQIQSTPKSEHKTVDASVSTKNIGVGPNKPPNLVENQPISKPVTKDVSVATDQQPVLQKGSPTVEAAPSIPVPPPLPNKQPSTITAAAPIPVPVPIPVKSAPRVPTANSSTQTTDSRKFLSTEVQTDPPVVQTAKNLPDKKASAPSIRRGSLYREKLKEKNIFDLPDLDEDVQVKDKIQEALDSEKFKNYNDWLRNGRSDDVGQAYNLMFD